MADRNNKIHDGGRILFSNVNDDKQTQNLDIGRIDSKRSYIDNKKKTFQNGNEKTPQDQNVLRHSPTKKIKDSPVVEDLASFSDRSDKDDNPTYFEYKVYSEDIPNKEISMKKKLEDNQKQEIERTYSPAFNQNSGTRDINSKESSSSKPIMKNLSNHSKDLNNSKESDKNKDGVIVLNEYNTFLNLDDMSQNSSFKPEKKVVKEDASDNTRRKSRRDGPLIVNLKKGIEQKLNNKVDLVDKNIKTVNQHTVGLVRQTAVELEDLGLRSNISDFSAHQNVEDSPGKLNKPKKKVTIILDEDEMKNENQNKTNLIKKSTSKNHNIHETDKHQLEKTNTARSEALTKVVTQKMEENSEFRALKEKNNQKLDGMRTLFYYSVEGKKEVTSYIISSGNYDSRNRIVPFYIILPNGKIKRIWDILLTLFLIYSLLIVPIDVGWNFECFTNDKGEMIRTSYLVICILFFFDILLNFFTAVLNEKNQYIFDLVYIAKNYLSTTFIFDFLAAFPFDRMVAFDMNDCFGTLSNSKIWLLFNLVRFLKLGKYIAIIEDILNKYITMVRLAKIFLMLLYLAHLFGNIFSGNSTLTVDYIFASCSYTETTEDKINCKTVFMKEEILSIYFYSVFIGMFFLTGNELPVTAHWERIYTVIVVIIALGLNASIFGNVAVMIGKMSVGLDPFVQEKIDTMKEYMNFMKFDSETIDTIQEYHKNIWMKQRNMMYPEDFFDNLSSALHKLILLDQWRTHFFTFSSFLPEISESFFGDMLPLMKPKIFMKEDVIIFEGEITTGGVYFIPQNCSCSVKIGGEWVKNMMMGEFFGEVAIFLRSRRRTATITCLKNSDFLCIEGEHFEKLLQDYPDDYNSIKIVAKDRILSHIKLYPSKLFAKLVPKNDLKDYLIRRCIYLNDEEEDAILEEKESENTLVNLDKILPKIELFNNLLSIAKNRLTHINKKLKPEEIELEDE